MNLVCVLHIEMSRRVGCRCMHDFITCKKNAAAQCQLPTNLACGQTRFQIGSWHCAAAFSLQVLKSCTDLNQTLVHFDMNLILLALITGNSSLEPLLEGLFTQIHIDLS